MKHCWWWSMSTAGMTICAELGLLFCIYLSVQICMIMNKAGHQNPKNLNNYLMQHIRIPRCEAGGTGKEKATNEGYHALFEPGKPRTKEVIMAELKKQVKLACSGVAQRIKESQTETGLICRFKDAKKDDPTRLNTDIEQELIEWTQASSDQIYSGFLTMKGFDPARDTPVEILHTILLSIVKYIWHISHTTWSEENKMPIP
ncbi:hypothetical protein C8F04DRAFT_1192874 [Mycena alexandri]|uniref:Uncharacterized protein n=1 Tax=Mycena alexandri TaxID=1745969 RepID=A0AAD6S9Z9_9AGAR|nr:hypothetical protein C8F04DRAFT_1192874 [Mycena alexandri]